MKIKLSRIGVCISLVVVQILILLYLLDQTCYNESSLFWIFWLHFITYTAYAMALVFYAGILYYWIRVNWKLSSRCLKFLD